MAQLLSCCNWSSSCSKPLVRFGRSM
jgi:hypothetical protein